MKFKLIHFSLMVTVLCVTLLFSTVNGKPSVILSTDSVNNDTKVDAPSNEGKGFAGPYKAFISYRRSVSKHLAMLIKVLLTERNVTAFLDVEDLRAGFWDNQLFDAIKTSPNFIFILSNGTLDRCIGDVNYTDVVHQEIKAAVDSKRNIIPIFDDFTMPAEKFSPEINEMMRFQGVEWNHSLVEGSMKRLVSYLRDDLTKLTYNHQ